MTEPPANADRARAEAAASGALRVGIFECSPLSQVTDRISGEKRGLGYDLGAEFARRLKVPLAYVAFQRIGFFAQFFAWSLPRVSKCRRDQLMKDMGVSFRKICDDH